MSDATPIRAAVDCTFDGDVAVVELGREDTVFVFDTAAVAALELALDRVEQAQPKCVVLAGNSRVFCAGADLTELAGLDVASFATWNERLAQAVNRVAALPMPVLAALHGHALGGGYELALAADRRVAAPGASVGLPEVSLGFIPGAGGVRRLAHLVGAHEARWMIMSAQRFGADGALAAGLIDEIDPAPRSRCLDLAGDLSSRSHEALTGLNRVICAGSGPEAYRTEQEVVTDLFDTPECRDRIAAFVARSGRARTDSEVG